MPRKHPRQEAANGVPARGNRPAHPWRNLSPLERVGMTWHDLRWQLAGSEYLSEWIDKKLALGKWYWLFLLGLNNSGTTLVKKVLQLHPLIRSFAREGQRRTDALPHPAKLGMGRVWGIYTSLFHWIEADDPRFAYRVMYDWARLYPPGPGILLEKSPTNSLRSRWLQQHFRPCRFLAIVRSPYAVCEGIRRRSGSDMEDAAQHWARGNERLFRDLKHLEHCTWIRYEDFVTDPTTHLSNLQEFLDLPTPFDADALRGVSAHSITGQSTGLQNLNARSLERLTLEDIRAINRIAAPLMEELGYELL